MTSPDQQRIKEEASLWLAKLDRGSLTVEEDDKLKLWLETDAEHRSTLLKLASTFDESSVLSKLSELFPLPHSSGLGRLSSAFNRLFYSGSIKAVAASVLVLVSLFYASNYLKILKQAGVVEHSARSYETEIGEQAEYQLVDGSTVILNTNSQITIDFSKKPRKVTLVKGEAHFEVAKDKNRPFTVHAGFGSIRAVGTAFSVRLMATEVDVTVTEGSVEILREGETELALQEGGATGGSTQKKVILRAGQTSQFNAAEDSVDLLSSTDIEKKLAWRESMLVFDGETLDQVVQQISRYTHAKIVIADPTIADIRVGGYFRSGDIAATLDILEDNFRIKATEVNPDLIRLSSMDSQ